MAGCAAWGAWAVEPHVALAASATNLVVTEEATLAFRLWMPPLEGDLADVPPVLNQRPPHVQAAFLEPDGTPRALVPTDSQHWPPVELRSRDRNVSVYTLNDYVSDDFFGGMRDPFSMLDDGFFGRALGPKAQRFPFTTRRVEREGVNGWEFSFTTAPYRAAAPGRAEIAPVAVKVPLITGVRTSRDRFGRAVRVPAVREVVLRTRPLVLEVIEPPAADRPATSCGAIASNLAVTATLDASVCTAGDPLVLTLDVAGARNPSALVPPSFAARVNRGGVFRLDDASLKTETLAASRRFSWRVRALKAGTVEFPSLEVGYYSLARRAYATVRTDAIPVQVKAGAQATLGALDAAGDEADAFPLPDGVDLDPRGATTEPLLPHLGLALALFFAAPLLVLALRLAPPARRRLAARRTAHRRATAFARCRRALARRDADARAAALRRFFAERYGVNGAAVTAADARRLMAGDFAEAEIALVVQALADLDRTHFAAKKALVALVAVCLAASGLFAASPAFTYRRASSLATHAKAAADFRAAARAYAVCAADGAANPVLFSNLGACALMAGDARGAWAAFARAERRSGETATTRRGLRAAWARLKNDPRADLPLTRVFFRPHVLYSLDARLVFAAGVWALGWLVALLPPGGVRRVLLTLAALAFLAASVSVSVSLVSEGLAEGAVYAVQ